MEGGGKRKDGGEKISMLFWVTPNTGPKGGWHARNVIAFFVWV